MDQNQIRLRAGLAEAGSAVDFARSMCKDVRIALTPVGDGASVIVSYGACRIGVLRSEGWGDDLFWYAELHGTDDMIEGSLSPSSGVALGILIGAWATTVAGLI